MGRKKSRASKTSKGSMNSVSKSIKRMMRVENRKDNFRRILNQLDAWKKGKNTKLDLGNPKKTFALKTR
jgi:hypothetical protein